MHDLILDKTNTNDVVVNMCALGKQLHAMLYLKNQSTGQKNGEEIDDNSDMGASTIEQDNDVMALLDGMEVDMGKFRSRCISELQAVESGQVMGQESESEIEQEYVTNSPPVPKLPGHVKSVTQLLEYQSNLMKQALYYMQVLKNSNSNDGECIDIFVYTLSLL